MNNKVTVMFLEERKKYTCIDGHPSLFLFLNSIMRELILQFKKPKAICEGVLVFLTGFFVVFRFCKCGFIILRF